ncbi:MAG: hypothetical protein ACUVRP_08930 [Chlorobiales bacterium]
MIYHFNKKDIAKIAKTLATEEPKKEGNLFRFAINDYISGRKLTLEIYPDLMIGSCKGNLIQVFSPVGLNQLHHCTNFITSEELGEVIFFAEEKEKLTGFVVSKDAGLTCYTNVDKDILSKDPFKLAGEVLGCAIQLGLTEHKLQEIK